MASLLRSIYVFFHRPAEQFDRCLPLSEYLNGSDVENAEEVFSWVPYRLVSVLFPHSQWIFQDVYITIYLILFDAFKVLASRVLVERINEEKGGPSPMILSDNDAGDLGFVEKVSGGG